MIPSHWFRWTLGALATLAIGCAHAPPRIVSVDFDVWAAAQPPPGVSRNAADRFYLLRPRARAIAEQQKIDVVLVRDALVYAAPDIDLTPTLIGRGSGPTRVGERVGIVNLQHALETTRDGTQAKATLREEFNRKQAELDRLQATLKAKYRSDPGSGQAAIETLRQRFRELQGELQQHEREATNVILRKLSPEVAELAKRHGLDVVLEASYKGEEVVYRDGVDYPPRGPDLTDELIRLHDERFR